MTGDMPALRASDEDRDRVVAALREHCVAGRLTLEEFAERTDRALEAQSGDELAVLTTDLPTDPPPPEPSLGTRTSVMVVGGMERRGRWHLPERFRVLGMFGGMDLDLTEAVVEAPLTVIDVWWVFGGVQLTVPDGIEVEVGGFTIFGGSDNDSSSSRAEAPRVLVRQYALAGGVSVETRRH
jgi:hypothetical protein